MAAIALLVDVALLVLIGAVEFVVVPFAVVAEVAELGTPLDALPFDVAEPGTLLA